MNTFNFFNIENSLVEKQIFEPKLRSLYKGD